MSEQDHQEGRIARLETVVEQVVLSIQGLEQSIEKYVAGQKTNWGTVFTGLGVLLLVVLAMNQAVIAPLERDVRNDYDRLDTFITERFNPLAERQSATEKDRFRKDDGLRLEDMYIRMTERISRLEGKVYDH